MIANIVQLLGVPIGNKFTRRDEYNVNGYFEDMEFIDWHQEISKTRNHTQVFAKINAGIDDKNMTVIPPDDKYNNIIHKRSEKYSIWGLKDPRLCIGKSINDFIDKTRGICNAKVIYVTRNKESIKKSMINVTSIAHSEVINRIVDDYKCNDVPVDRIVVKYDDVIDNPRYWVKKISEFCGINGDIDKACSIVNSAYKRY